MPLIILIFCSTLYSFQLNLIMNQFQIQTPPRLNQLMMMKWNIYWNSSIRNMMKTFCMLNYRWFRIDWWLPLLKNVIQSLLGCLIKMEEQMLQSQISCHTFLCLSQLRPLWNWLIETRDMTKKWVLFMSIYQLFHYIFIGDSLLFLRPSFQQLIIRWPQILCWVSKGYIWTSWILWLCWPSGLFWDMTLTDKKTWISSNKCFQSQPSQRQEYCCAKSLCT